MEKAPVSRPGGRSLRVQEAVFGAMEALLTENDGDMPSMAAVAARAQVNPTSLYRRWRDIRFLAGAVAVDRLMRDLPVPDTGSLRGDLTGWAASAAASLGTHYNVTLLRILTAVPQSGGTATDLHDRPIGRRVRELEIMLARAAPRGETAPPVMDVLQIVLAPIYLRALFLGPIESTDGVEGLVDRLLTMAVCRCSAGGPGE